MKLLISLFQLICGLILSSAIPFLLLVLIYWICTLFIGYFDILFLWFALFVSFIFSLSKYIKIYRRNAIFSDYVGFNYEVAKEYFMSKNEIISRSYSPAPLNGLLDGNMYVFRKGSDDLYFKFTTNHSRESDLIDEFIKLCKERGLKLK